eukprot:7587720-Pyramimonas_sp.AAC.1
MDTENGPSAPGATCEIAELRESAARDSPSGLAGADCDAAVSRPSGHSRNPEDSRPPPAPQAG